mmetsp:Transcript_48631/g.126842  ORF Transcript_48631/g.126842 Transcript_48631/m.126842 type:complete len:218 (-) Transcript_48631:259-912(-)
MKIEASKVNKSLPDMPACLLPPFLAASLLSASTCANLSASFRTFHASKDASVTGVPPGGRAARFSSMISSMVLSSGATSRSTSAWHRSIGLLLSGSPTQKTLSFALINKSSEMTLNASTCLSFRAWMIGCPPSSDMRMPLAFVSRMVLAMPSMISFLNSSFNFLPAATASSSACFAFFFATGSKALPFLSVSKLNKEFKSAAFATSFCLASFSSLFA